MASSFNLTVLFVISAILIMIGKPSLSTDRPGTEAIDHYEALSGFFHVEARKKESTDFLSKIAPQLVMPFMLQVMILPIVLTVMKVILLNSMFVGKIGILLWIFIIIRNRLNQGGGLYSHNVNIEHNHSGHR